MERGKGRFYRIHWFWNILRNGLFLMGVRNRLQKIGLDFDPYYWELESPDFAPLPVIRESPDDYTLEHLSYAEMKELLSLIQGMDKQIILSGIEAGQQCIGLRYKDGTVAVFMLIETRAVDYKKKIIPLANYEAYLMGMYTFQAFRGRNLAPYLRYRSYELLRDMGRDRLYSISAFFNKSSLKFKGKLGVRHHSLHLHIGLFKKWRWNFLLKKYPSQGVPIAK